MIVLTPPVTVTASVPKVLVSVKKDGKVLIVVQWIKMLFNAYPTVPDTVHLNSTPNHVFVRSNGVETTVPSSCATLIVVLTVLVSVKNVLVKMVGAVIYATPNFAIPVVTSMVNVRMAPVSVLLVGTENIAQSKVVQAGK